MLRQAQHDMAGMKGRIAMLIDCHAHLDSYSDAEVGEILERGRRVGVGFVVSAGTTLETSRRSIELSGTFDDFLSLIHI